MAERDLRQPHVMPGDEHDKGKKDELITIKVQKPLLRDLKRLGAVRGRSYSKLLRALGHAEIRAAVAAGEIPEDA